jgi:hypothetical protein
MSETIEQEQQPAVEPAVTEAPEAVEAPQEAPEQQAEEAPKPEGEENASIKKRFATMTRKLSEKQNELEKLRQQYENAQALLQKGEEAPRGAQSEVDIDRAVNERLAQREFDTRRQALISEGAKQFGREGWAEKTEVLHGLGATQNAAFMQALVELPNASQLVAHLADDTDELLTLLNKSPVQMAAAMGRMAAAMPADTAPRASEKPLSAAPKPVKQVTAPAVVKEPTAYDANLSMADYVKLRAKTAPRHLR